MTNNNLPFDRKLDIGALSGLFNNTTNSYKYLFFFGILESITRNRSIEKLKTVIQIDELIAQSLRFGWYPHRFFKLSFGSQDKAGDALDKLEYKVNDRSVGHKATAVNLLSAIKQQFKIIKGDEFARYVPYRLIVSFFGKELKGIKDSTKSELIRDLALERFYTDSPPLYRFTDDLNAIELHPLWLEYLSINYSVIRGWALYEWAIFLQKRNPNTPSILHKIEPPSKRSPLKQQCLFWNEVLETDSLLCIYSGAVLKTGAFHLDHFIPWSFICHDELWNIIPASPSANLTKGRSLPCEDNINDFIDQQSQAIHISHQIMEIHKWRKVVKPYVAGLGISHNEILIERCLYKSYKSKINPLVSLASQMGFKT